MGARGDPYYFNVKFDQEDLGPKLVSAAITVGEKEGKIVTRQEILRRALREWLKNHPESFVPVSRS